MTFLSYFTLKRYVAGLNATAVVVHSLNVILLGVYHMSFKVPLRYTSTTFADSEHHVNKITNESFFVTKEWGSVNITTLLMMNEGISLVSSLLGMFNTWGSSDDKIIYYERIRLATDLSLTYAGLEMIIMLVMGETDLFLLGSFFVLLLIQQICGYLVKTEKRNGTHKFLYFFIGSLVFLWTQTIVITKSLSVTGMSSRDRIAIATVNAIMFALFGIHLYLSDGSKWYSKQFNRHTFFILLSFSTKTIVTWLCFTSLKTILETIQPDYIEYSIDWKEAFNIVLYVVLVFFICAAGFLYTVRPYDPLSKTTTKTPKLPNKKEPESVNTQHSDDDVLKIECRNGVPLMGKDIPMLGPTFFTETDSLL